MGDRFVAVTGGANGIGAALVSHLTGNGISAVILDVDVEAGNRVAECVPGPGEAHFVQADVTDEMSLERAAEIVASWTPQLDGLVACAGVVAQGRADEVDVETWDRSFDVNVRGVWLAARSLYPLLRQAQGTIVSVASMHAYATRSGYAVYAASKAAVVGLTRGMAADFASDGVRVVGVAPSGVRTGTTIEGFVGREEELEQSVQGRYPLGRLAEPQEIVDVVDFLLWSATYITGSVVRVDGGVLATL